MKIKLPFKGTKAEGKARIEELLKKHSSDIAKNASAVETTWDGDILSFAFTAQGSHIEGTAEVRDGEIEIYAKLPLALRLFEGTIERMIAIEAAKIRL